MRARLIWATLTASTRGVLSTACTSNATTTDPNSIVFPDTLVRYQNHVDPFLTLRCGGPCHAGPDPAGGIDLTQYNNLFFDRPNLVVSGKPDESLLCQVLERVIGHAPGQLETIPSNQVQGVRQWVLEGAQNN